MNIKKNDTVIVLSGKDKGKKGKVLEAMPASGKVIVEGVNVATCHVKPRKQGEEGGIIRREIPCMPARSCASARSAARLPAPYTRSLTATKSASAKSAARRFEREVLNNGC